MRQGLTDAVDLIIMTSIRKSEELGFQICEPWHSVRKKHLALDVIRRAFEAAGIEFIDVQSTPQ
jgi:hypothetical protein